MVCNWSQWTRSYCHCWLMLVIDVLHSVVGSEGHARHWLRGESGGGGGDSNPSILAAALDALVRMLVQLREVLPHFLLILSYVTIVGVEPVAVEPVRPHL